MTVHSPAVLRLTQNGRAVAEIAAIAEHGAALTSATAAFGLPPDVAELPATASLVPLLDAESAPDAADTLAEIQLWARESLGMDGVPAIWRALAHQPRLLEATWRKDRLILSPGVLEQLVKGCAALAVAQFRQSAYWIAYLTAFLRHTCGLDDQALVQLAEGHAFRVVQHHCPRHAPGPAL